MSFCLFFKQTHTEGQPHMSSKVFEKCFPMLDCDANLKVLVNLGSELEKHYRQGSASTTLTPQFYKKLIDAIAKCDASCRRVMGLIVDMQVLQRQQLQQQSWYHNTANCTAHQVVLESHMCRDSTPHTKKTKRDGLSSSQLLDEEELTENTNDDVQFFNMPLNAYPFVKQLMPSFSTT